MDIRKYTAYFHDGGLIKIDSKGKNILLSLSSAEMNPDDFSEKLPFSDDDRLKGILHLEGVKTIYVNDKQMIGPLTQEYDSGSIFDLSIENNSVQIIAGWFNFPPKEFLQTDFFKYKIVAENIFWEPIPNLYDPFWE